MQRQTPYQRPNPYQQRGLMTTPRIMAILERRANERKAQRDANGHDKREAAQVLSTQLTILRMATRAKHISDAEAAEIETLLRAGLPYVQAAQQVKAHMLASSHAARAHPEDSAPAAPSPGKEHDDSAQGS